MAKNIKNESLRRWVELATRTLSQLEKTRPGPDYVWEWEDPFLQLQKQKDEMNDPVLSTVFRNWQKDSQVAIDNVWAAAEKGKINIPVAIKNRIESDFSDILNSGHLDISLAKLHERLEMWMRFSKRDRMSSGIDNMDEVTGSEMELLLNMVNDRV